MFKKPNFTQTPNEFFDDIAKTLKEGELRVLLVIMRQTFGWGNKEWDRISITQLMEKTGMSRDAVIRSTKTLIEKELVVKHKEGTKGEEKSWYSLVVESPSEFMNPIDDSNNLDQSSKKTPPSLLKRPTKETLTKEKENIPGPSVPPPPQASEITSLLREAIKKIKPDIKMSSEESYAKVIRRMLTLDNRSPELIKRVIRWLPTNDFWSTVVLSANKFREQFDKLELSMHKGPSQGPSNDLQLVNRLKEYVSIHHRNDVVVGPDYVDFCNLRESCYKVGEPAFREKVLNGLRKIGVPIK